jgi:hypothetical protein
MHAVKRFGGVLFGLGALGAFAGAVACGPSFQAIYEGNSRFEHCYALEERAQTPIHEKADCWRDWSEHYTYGQTRDRIHYATARYVALSQSTNVPTDEAMMMAAPGMTPRQSTITAPAPTSAFAPPPKVLDEYPDASAGKAVRPNEVPTVVGTGSPSGSSEATPRAPSVTLPASDCSDGCGKGFRDCGSTCADASASKPDAGKDAVCTLCEKTYRSCMRSCFK